MSRCVECGAYIDPGLECPWRHDDEPTCSTCCGHDDENPAPAYDLDAAWGRALGWAFDRMGLDHHQTVKETTT